MGKLEDFYKKHPFMIGYGIITMMFVLVKSPIGDEDLLEQSLTYLIGIGIFLIFYFIFGKLNKRYYGKRLKEKEGEE
jgi:O-antigen/teichoic acid export membrane protein